MANSAVKTGGRLSQKPQTKREVLSVKKPRIVAWSNHRYTTYQQCPHKARLMFIDGHKTEPSPAMEAGLALHKEAERYLLNGCSKVPAILKPFAKELKELRRAKAKPEVEWAFDKNWKIVDWFSKDAWLRVKSDVLCVKGSTLRLIDHKTGKVREEEHKQQLELYALGGFLALPEITEVLAELWYYDSNHVIASTFMREELESLRQTWLERTARMLNDTSFAPTPNFMCRYCDFRKASGRELCEF